MTALQLHELEQQPPDPTRHWLVYGLVRAGDRLLVQGGPGAGRTLWTTELAIAATTYCRVAGGSKPLLAGPAVVVTADPFVTATTARLLLSGRGLVRAPDCRFLPAPPDWPNLLVQLEAVVDPAVRLLVLDLAPTVGLREPLARWCATRPALTTVVAQQQDDDDWRGWRTRELAVTFDTVRQLLTVQPADGHARASLLVSTATTRRWVAVPSHPLAALEYAVLAELGTREHATSTEVCRMVGLENQRALVRDALDHLVALGLVMRDGQKKRADKWSYYVWSIRRSDEHS